MDFAKFLKTGELSDVTVTVDGKEFHLHKFPLFIKSDFFRALARRSADASGRQQVDDLELDSGPGVAKIVLTDFPGGPDTFELVAAYCYNVRIEVTRYNVCQLRCAAEFLQMTGSGNLAGVADRVLLDTLTSAKIRRRLDVITQLLRQCQKLGPIAEHAKIVASCLEAIVDSWLLPSKFSTRSSRFNSSDSDVDVFNRLIRLPLNWFTELIRVARSRSVSAAQLTSLVERYITAAVHRHEGNITNENEANRTRLTERRSEAVNQPIRNGKSNEPAELNGKEDEDGEQEYDDDYEEEEETANEGDKSVPAADEKLAAKSYSPSATRKRRPKDDDAEETMEDLEELKGKISDAELRDVIDILLLDIPAADYPIVADFLPPRWIIDLLAKTELIGCEKSRVVLLKLASFVTQRFGADDLSQLEPETFIGLVRASCGSNGPHEAGSNDDEIPSADHALASQQVCRAVDVYLKSLSERDELTVDIFRRVVDAVPDESRTNDDTFFDVLRNLLSSEKASDMDESERQSLLDSIDYNRLSETALRTALDSKLVPAAFVAKAALNLCSTLRKDLDAANAAIRQQRADVDRYLTGGRDTNLRERDRVSTNNGLRTSVDLPERKYRHRSTSSSFYAGPSYRTGTGSAVYDVRRRHPVTGSSTTSASYRSVPSLASHLELRLALDQLNEDTGRYGSVSSEIPDVSDCTSASARYGSGVGSTGSYYGYDSSSGDPLFSSSYARSSEPLSLTSTTRSPYGTSTASTTLRSSSYVKRR